MHTRGMTTLVRTLRRAASAHTAGEQADAHCVRCFVTTRDEEAFEALVLRHGPMVLGVCRRVLGSVHDAEDAFQATFLILARKAGSVSPPEAVARWLHGVAYHTALKARDASIRRRARERKAYTPPPSTGPAERWSELRSILDQELSRLPNDYRAAVVLCDLEGLTRHDAALQLGWPEGTVAGRLARARELLAGRLTRRGVALSAAGLTAVWAEAIASAAPTSAMVRAALQAALTSKTPAAVALLANSVLHASVATRLATAALLLVVLGFSGAGLYFHGANAADDPKGPADPVAEAKDQPLAAQAKKPGAVFKVPGSGTLGVALSPDGKILARAGTSPAFGPYGDTGHTVDLWDVASGKKLHTLTGHTETIIKLAFSPDGKSLASSTSPLAAEKPRHELKLWDVATGKERAPVGGHRKNISFRAFSPDGKTLATSSADPGVVKLWDMATGKEKMELGVGASLDSLAFSPDGKTLAMSVGGSWEKPGSVQLWDLTTGKKRATMPGTDSWDSSVGFTPDGKTLVSAGHLTTNEEGQKGLFSQLKLWDVATAKERATIPVSGQKAAHAAPLVFTADGKTLITTAWIFEKDLKPGAPRIRLSVQHWDLATGKARATFWTPVNPGGTAGYIEPGIWYSALSADGKTVAWGGRDGTGPPYIGTAHVWEVGSLATSPPETPEEPKKSDPEGTKKPGADKKVHMVTMGVLVLISAKTEGLSEGAKIKQIDALKESIGKRDISNAHVTKGRAVQQATAAQPRLNGTWVKKTCTVTLEGGKPLENREVLFGIDFPEQALKNLRFVETVQAESDQGVGTWYAYDAADMQLPAPEDLGPDDAKDKDDGWVSLFNGKDLTGWVVEGDNPEAWRVEGDELVVDAAKGGRRYNWLLTEKTYSEFILRFEYQLSEKATSGVGLWASRYEKVHPEGPNHLQVKLLDDPNYPNIGWPTGTLFWNVDGGSHLRPDKRAELGPVWGAWNIMEIEARTQSLRVSVSGREVSSVKLDPLADEPGAYPGLKRREGHVGFMKAVGVARFRNIEIKELKPVSVPQDKKEPAPKAAPTNAAEKSTPKATADGWVSLFNGNDLTGWKTHPVAPGDWRVEDGILIGRGPKVSHLYTERGDYEDLHFRVEARINAGGNSGQCFRKQFSAKIGGDGYEAQIDSSSHKAKTGSLYNHLSPAVAIEEVLVPVDTWFTQEVIIRGYHIVILVNGQKTVDFIDKNHNYARGHLALQVFDPATVVHFRKIEIKELKSAVAPTSAPGNVPIADKLLEQRQFAANLADIKAALAKRLRDDPTAPNRVYVAEALWQADKDPAAVAALAAILKNEYDAFREANILPNAVEALDRIGPEAKAAVPALLEALDEGWVWERKYAVWAASVCTAPGCRAGAGGPPDRLPPGKAAWLLWRIDKHPAVMPALLSALKDPVHRAGAAEALGRIGVEAKEAVPALVKLLHDENGATRIDFVTEGPLTRYREALTYALWQINKHPAYIPALVEGLKDKNPSMRVYYIHSLGRIGAEAHAAVPALAEALNDEKGFVGLAAAEALGRIAADAAVPALLEALKDRGRMRVAAAEALWQINKHPRAVPALTEALTDQADYTDVYASSALRRIGAEAKAAAPDLAKSQINKDPAYIRALIENLEKSKSNEDHGGIVTLGRIGAELQATLAPSKGQRP